MASQPFSGLRAAVVLLVLAWGTIALASSISMNYCATINTASMSGNHSIYQSDGLCHDFCNDQAFALAIVQGEYCWCSNYVPDSDDQVSVSNCQESCPGFPDDVCGGDGTFGYMSLESSPSGTAGSGSEATSTTAGSKTSSTAKTTAPAAIPTVQTVTVGGTVQTVTATPTAVIGSPSTGNISSKSGGGGLSTGGAVGLAVGLVALAVAVAGGFIFWCLRRRRRRQEEAGAMYDPSHRGSSAGMTQTPKSPSSGDNPQFVFGPVGSANPGVYETDQSGRRRSGMLRPIDPRMDPHTTTIYNGENKSHDSVNTLRDDQDYSRKVHHPARVLRATNPDPDFD